LNPAQIDRYDTDVLDDRFGRNEEKAIMDTLAQAYALGVVTRAEVERGIAEARPDASTGRTEITLRGRVVALVHRDGEHRNRRIRPLLTALAEEDLGPRVLSCTDQLWTESVPGRSLAELSSQGARPTLVELTDACVALGAALAGVHRLPVPRDATEPARRPTIEAGGHDGGGSALDAAVRHAVAVDPGLQRAFEAVSQRWSDRHWALGRVEPVDIMIDSRSGSHVRFANLDSAGLGCVDWDVAACLASIAQVAGPAASVAWLSGHFWNSYRRAGGPGQIHPQVQAMHAVESACRAASRDDGSAVVWWLTRAHDALVRPGAALAA